MMLVLKFFSLQSSSKQYLLDDRLLLLQNWGRWINYVTRNLNFYWEVSFALWILTATQKHICITFIQPEKLKMRLLFGAQTTKNISTYFNLPKTGVQVPTEEIKLPSVQGRRQHTGYISGIQNTEWLLKNGREHFLHILKQDDVCHSQKLMREHSKTIAICNSFALVWTSGTLYYVMLWVNKSWLFSRRN